ncbi:MAG: hypothetical protein IKC27_01425 [Kiritimatiellae bacterium]|nr:hypothetical protein [Kiritimatiellia bacterium]
MFKNKISVVLILAILSASVAFAQGFRRSRTLSRGEGAGGASAAAASTGTGTAEVAALKGLTGDATSDLNFKDAVLEIVFEAYSQLVGRTVLKDPSVQSVTITIQSAPGQKLTKEEQIFVIEEALEMNGVHMENYGEKFVRALPRDKVRQEGIPLILDEDAELADDNKVVSIFVTFKNIPVEEAKTALEGLKSPKGLLLVYERIGKILVTDTRMNINRMREVARQIDVGTPVNENVFVRQIVNASAAEIKVALELIVQESQKSLENQGVAARNAQGNYPYNRYPMMYPGGYSRMQPNGGNLLRRPGQPGNQPAQPTNVESKTTSVSDADRGLIRGKVLIMSDERSNKLIVVTAKTNMDFFDKVIKELDVETTPDTQVKVYRLKYAEAEDVSDMINELIGNASSSSGKGNQNQAARSGTSGNLTRSTSTANRNTATQRTAANQRTGDAKAGELTKDNTVVLADKRINGLVVMTQKELVPTVEKIIESMDIKLSQVLIETAIIEVTLGDDLATGIDWVLRGRQKGQIGTKRVIDGYDDNDEPIYKDIPVYGMIRDGFVNSGSSALGGGGGSGSAMLKTMMNVASNAVGSAVLGGANPIGSGVNYLLKSDKLNLAAVIQASKSDSRAKYLASPIIMTVDNNEATIDATEKRKFFNGYETSSSYSTYVRTPKYDSEDIGIKIKVKPKINPNGTVMLNVDEEYSQLGAGQAILVDDGGTVNIDTFMTRKMTAEVVLDDRQTVVLGGLTERYTSEKETGIPILKDIPWVGKWLFGSVTQTESRKELLVFMTPYVLNDAEAAQAEALRRKRSLSDSRAWESLGWSDSELADPVSKKELLRRLKEEAERQDEERQNRLAVEKWKMDRAKALEKMSEAERKFWLEQHREELSEEEREAFDRQAAEQADLKVLADSIREKGVKKAEEDIKKAESDEKKKANEKTESSKK